MADIECKDCGNEMLDVPKSEAHNGGMCDVCGSRNTKVI